MVKRLRKGALAAVAAAAIAVPVMPAAPASAGENCFIHTDDWVACVCGPVARLLADLTGDPWTCA